MTNDVQAFEDIHTSFTEAMTRTLRAQEQHIMVSSPPGFGVFYTLSRLLPALDRPHLFVRTSMLMRDEFLYFDDKTSLQASIAPFRGDDDVTVYEEADLIPDDALAVLETFLTKPTTDFGSQIVLLTNRLENLMPRLSQAALDNIIHLDIVAPE
jgi:hypothetical protein